MPRTTCYEEFCGVETKDIGFYAPLIVLAIVATVAIATVLLNDASMIGTDMTNMLYLNTGI